MLKKYLINFFLVCWLLVMFIDAAPSKQFGIAKGIDVEEELISMPPKDWADDPYYEIGVLETVYVPVTNWHFELKKIFSPYLYSIGLWQGNWKLFGPEPDKVNVTVSLELVFADGTTLVLDTPQWRELSAWKRLCLFRESEYVDELRVDGNSCIWPPYVKYMREITRHPTKREEKAIEAVLSRRWVEMGPPNSFTVTQFPEPPEQTNSYIMFVDTFEPEGEVEAAKEEQR